MKRISVPRRKRFIFSPTLPLLLHYMRALGKIGEKNLQTILFGDFDLFL